VAARRPGGGALRSAALSWGTQGKREAGDVGGLATAGRSGPGPPPRPSRMPAGGVPPPQQWREGADWPLPVGHKQGPDARCTRRQQRVGRRALPDTIDAVGRTSPRGLVASVAEGKVPAGGSSRGAAVYRADGAP
jgi:hypothetical protein